MNKFNIIKQNTVITDCIEYGQEGDAIAKCLKLTFFLMASRGSEATGFKI